MNIFSKLALLTLKTTKNFRPRGGAQSQNLKLGPPTPRYMMSEAPPRAGTFERH